MLFVPTKRELCKNRNAILRDHQPRPGEKSCDVGVLHKQNETPHRCKSCISISSWIIECF